MKTFFFWSSPIFSVETCKQEITPPPPPPFSNFWARPCIFRLISSEEEKKVTASADVHFSAKSQVKNKNKTEPQGAPPVSLNTWKKTLGILKKTLAIPPPKGLLTPLDFRWGQPPFRLLLFMGVLLLKFRLTPLIRASCVHHWARSLSPPAVLIGLIPQAFTYLLITGRAFNGGLLSTKCDLREARSILTKNQLTTISSHIRNHAYSQGCSSCTIKQPYDLSPVSYCK